MSASASSSTMSIPGTAAAGGLSMTQPPSTAAASFYKIADSNYVTFGWNLTSLYATPTSLTIIASCSQNGNTYPIGPTTAVSAQGGGEVTQINNVVPGTATQVVWNPYHYEQIPGATPLAIATYTLKVWDERGPTASVAGGRFNPYSGTQFALYRPQAYTPLPNWTCTGCSAAIRGITTSPGAIILIVTSMIMLLSGWNLLGGYRRRG